MFNDLNVKLKKVVAIFLIITLTYANFILLGSNIVGGLISYAALLHEQNAVEANQELVMNKVCNINGEDKRVIQIAMETGVESENSPIKETTITLKTDIINGTLEDIVITELNKNSYTVGTWEQTQDGKVTISLINENETIKSKSKGLDKFLVTYVFQDCEIETIKKPIEKVEVKTYLQDVLVNEAMQVAFEGADVEKELLELNIENNNLHKTKIEEGQIEFTENLNLDLSYRKDTLNITIEDVENSFYNNDNNENTEAVLKYKTTTIKKEVLTTLLGETGKLVIINQDLEKTLAEITNEYINEQELNVKTEQKFVIEDESSEELEEVRTYITVNEDDVVIEYALDVTNLKFELTNMKEQSSYQVEPANFVVGNTKIISNINNVDLLNDLQHNVKYIIDEVEKTANSTIKFKDTITKASLEVDNTNWVVGQANTVKYTITLDTLSEKSELFINPRLFIELPSSVESVNTANSKFKINNDNGVFTNKKVVTATVMERKFVVVTLEGAQTEDSILNENATIELTLELNVKDTAVEGNEITKLYYQNDTVTAYESGKCFDTAEVTVDMIMVSEPKEDVETGTEPEEGTTPPEEGGEEIIPEDETYVSVYVSADSEDVIKQGEEFEYRVHVYNHDTVEKQNLQVIDVLPEGVTFVKVVEEFDILDLNENVDYNYNEAARTLTINVDKIQASVEEEIENQETGEKEITGTVGYRQFIITVKANSLEQGVFSKEIVNNVKVQETEKVLAEDEITNTISAPFLTVETEKLAEKVNEGAEIVLGLKVKNNGLINASGVNINITLPEQISARMYTVKTLSNTGVESNVSESTLNSNFEDDNVEVKAQETYYVQIIGTVENIEETEDLNIIATVNGEEYSWTIKVEETPGENENPDGSENPDENETPGGSENPGENETPGGSENPGENETPGGSENPGENEKPGGSENPGENETPGGSENPGENETPGGSENPGENETPGESETPGGNENPGEEQEPEKPTDTFDLSLKQILNKVTVTNSQGTTTYNYTDTNFAKIEIHSKHMNGSKVTLEYKIIVKNEGTIPGYVGKIVNYKEKDLSFNQNINKNWYVGEDGNIYSVALADKLLNPGETTEALIVLEKQMTNDNVGTITNLVEICEAVNSENVEDINSIPGDKIEGQNDMSKVEVLVSTSTGTIILYTTLALAVISILGVGFYKIRKITLNKKGGC